MLQLFILGIFIGILSGLFGIGGGIVLVPFLKYFYEIQKGIPSNISMHLAVSCSLAVILFTSSSSALKFTRTNQVNQKVFYHITPGRLLGVLIGAFIAPHLNGALYTKMFGLLLLLIALKIGVEPEKNPEQTNQKIEEIQKVKYFGVGFYLFSFISGLLTAIFGLGGGVIMTPYFLHLGLSVPMAIGTTTVASIPAVLLSAIVYACSAPNMTHELPLNYLTGYIHWPSVINIAITGVCFAPLGVKMALAFPQKLLKQLFAVILILIGLKMIW